ncbi:hypothetical protein FOC1_g10005731 [Fusarium oxysporum f. sp. cubense race 1]|uniref:Major facilitator superfamily (MFS) profile domain-containing protein n=1 Tax=Fusarium oxysporum f. sp. cubense (strain race 1) TaxID=1229664 RepID=N4U4T4_FUSC1|nr:hypothetical protein FOC1_g10005731 [Fusarium oxysporum f. sp. cubense race 1]
MSDRSSCEHRERANEVSSEVQGNSKVSMKSLLLLLSINLVYFVQVANVVGSGALTRDISAVVGGSHDSVWYSPLLHAISSEVVARKYRPWAQGSINVSASLGAIVGLLIEKMRNLDWVGYGFLTPALVLFCMSLAWSGNPYSWTDAHVLATFLIGVLSGVALIVYETSIKKNGIVLFAIDNIIIGAQYSMAFIALGISAIVSGIWCSISKALRFPIILAFGFKILFMVLMATVSKSTPQALIWIYPITLGLGLGVCMPALITVAHFATPRELIAITSGLMISIRSLGGSIGLAVFNAIFSNGLSSNLGPKISHVVLPLGFPERELPQLIAALAHNDTVALKQIHGISPEIIHAGVDGLLEAYRVSFRGVWLTTASLCLVASIAGFFLRDPTEKFTSQIDAPIAPDTEVVEIEKRTKSPGDSA